MSVSVLVSYSGTKDTKFDRDYYVNSHIPLCRKWWNDSGMLNITALFPPVELKEGETGTIAVCTMTFKDAESMGKCFQNTEAMKEVNGDIPNYTNSTATLSKLVPMGH